MNVFKDLIEWLLGSRTRYEQVQAHHKHQAFGPRWSRRRRRRIGGYPRKRPRRA